MGLLPMLSVQPVAGQGTLLPTPYAIDVRIFCRAKKRAKTLSLHPTHAMIMPTAANAVLLPTTSAWVSLVLPQKYI
jgi:hypothetical protein